MAPEQPPPLCPKPDDIPPLRKSPEGCFPSKGNVALPLSQPPARSSGAFGPPPPWPSFAVALPAASERLPPAGQVSTASPPGPSAAPLLPRRRPPEPLLPSEREVRAGRAPGRRSGLPPPADSALSRLELSRPRRLTKQPPGTERWHAEGLPLEGETGPRRSLFPAPESCPAALPAAFSSRRRLPALPLRSGEAGVGSAQRRSGARRGLPGWRAPAGEGNPARAAPEQPREAAATAHPDQGQLPPPPS